MISRKIMVVGIAMPMLFLAGCGSTNDKPSEYDVGKQEGYSVPDRVHQNHPYVGEMGMDIGDEVGYTPSASGKSTDYQRGHTDGYYQRRGEIDNAQKPAFSNRVDKALD